MMSSAAARATGVNSYTGRRTGGCSDRARTSSSTSSNSSYTDEEAARDFFYTSTMNLLNLRRGRRGAPSRRPIRRRHRPSGPCGGRLLRGERAAGADDRRVATPILPLVHATQFFEFIRNITDQAARSGAVRVAGCARAADGRRRCRRSGRSHGRRRTALRHGGVRRSGGLQPRTDRRPGSPGPGRTSVKWSRTLSAPISERVCRTAICSPKRPRRSLPRGYHEWRIAATI